MQWIADRFFRGNQAWIDIATGRPVRLRLLAAASVDELAWNDECARLSTMRHPLLNTLLDYGPAVRGRLFEAFEHNEPAHAAASGSSAGTFTTAVPGSMSTTQKYAPYG